MGERPLPAGRAILLLSVGAKTALADSIRAAMSRQRGFEVLLTSDLNEGAPGHRSGDGQLPIPALADDDAIPPTVTAMLVSSRVTLVIPTRDGELLFWAKNAEALKREGIDVVVSSWSTVSLALDKLAFAAAGAEIGLPTVPTTDRIPSDQKHSLVVKERFGAGSRSIAIDVGRADALRAAASMHCPVFQPYLRGEEFSVDAWVSRSGVVRGPVVRRRDTVTNGESSVTTTTRDRTLESLALSVLAWLPARGPVNLQIIRTSDGCPHLVEVNTRFGGASTCSLHAGLDVWRWELAEHLGQPPEPFHRIAGEVRQVRKRLPDGSALDQVEHLSTGP